MNRLELKGMIKKEIVSMINEQKNENEFWNIFIKNRSKLPKYKSYFPKFLKNRKSILYEVERHITYQLLGKKVTDVDYVNIAITIEYSIEENKIMLYGGLERSDSTVEDFIFISDDSQGDVQKLFKKLPSFVDKIVSNFSKEDIIGF